MNKTAGRIRRTPAADAPVWPLLTCEACGGALKRTGGGSADKSIVYLRCKDCGQTPKLSRNDLVQEILLQYNAYIRAPQGKYEPSEEVIHLNNTINRALEHAGDPNEVIRLILQGASARYCCCPVRGNVSEVQSLAKMDWNYFRRIVSAIQISKDGQVMLVFQSDVQKEGR